MPRFPPRSPTTVTAEQTRRSPSRQQTAGSGGKPSFNYLVGANHHVGRDLKTERFGGLKIHDQLKFGGLLDRQVARLCALEDFVNEPGGPVIQVREAWPVAQQASHINEYARYVDSRQPLLAGKIDDHLS